MAPDSSLTEEWRQAWMKNGQARDLHRRRFPENSIEYCEECSRLANILISYPCPTIHTLEGDQQ